MAWGKGLKIDPIITDMEVLHKMSKPTSWDEIKKLNLIERLKESTKTAWVTGIGLAAIQIGIRLRMAWFILEGKEYVLVNPAIVATSSPVIVPREGCLSIPNVWSQTRRFHNITIRTISPKGMDTLEFSGLAAIIVQHEIDHMNGVLNLQRRYFPEKRVGRNSPCPCGSGKKYKKCCIDKIKQPEGVNEKDS